MFGRKAQPTESDYKKLGKNLEAVLVKDYIELVLNTRRQIWLSLVRGFMAGLAGVIGATLGVTLLLLLLHLFGGIPVIGDFFQYLSENIGHN